jgi:hypothetical protein
MQEHSLRPPRAACGALTETARITWLAPIPRSATTIAVERDSQAMAWSFALKSPISVSART